MANFNWKEKFQARVGTAAEAMQLIKPGNSIFIGTGCGQPQYLCNALGQGASPFDCWLVLRGIKTLVPRMLLHEQNADAVARFLAGHRAVKHVYYPGLKAHPHHEIARRQQSGFGGIVSFEVAGGLKEVHHVLRSVKVFALAESLGGVESLIDHPLSMTHASMDPVLREEAGITENLIRLSVGLESIDDILEDLRNALDTIPKN